MRKKFFLVPLVQKPRRLLLPAGTTVAGALGVGHALAQTTLGARATAIAQDSLNWGSIATVALYLIAAFAVITGVVAVWQIGKRNQQVSPMVPICAFLAAFIAAGAGYWVGMGSQTVTGQAPSITGASSQPLQLQ
jgi:hypothetical protein